MASTKDTTTQGTSASESVQTLDSLRGELALLEPTWIFERSAAGEDFDSLVAQRATLLAAIAEYTAQANVAELEALSAELHTLVATFLADHNVAGLLGVPVSSMVYRGDEVALDSNGVDTGVKYLNVTFNRASTGSAPSKRASGTGQGRRSKVRVDVRDAAGKMERAAMECSMFITEFGNDAERAHSYLTKWPTNLAERVAKRLNTARPGRVMVYEL